MSTVKCLSHVPTPRQTVNHVQWVVTGTLTKLTSIYHKKLLPISFLFLFYSLSILSVRVLQISSTTEVPTHVDTRRRGVLPQRQVSRVSLTDRRGERVREPTVDLPFVSTRDGTDLGTVDPKSFLGDRHLRERHDTGEATPLPVKG